MLLAAALSVPFSTALAQQATRVYRIGVLEAIPAAENAANLDALRNALRDLGYVEGRNLVIDYRSADGHAERFAELAQELAHAKVDLLLTRGTPAAHAAKQATATIPILMATMGDPRVVVASFARPGGNVTGVTTFSTELSAKRIELLKELVPSLSQVALLHNMSNPAVPAEWDETAKAAQRLGIGAELLDVRSRADVDRALARAAQHHVQGLIVDADGLLQASRGVIVDFAARNRIPAMYPAREYVDAGGLISYAVNYPDLYARLARYADAILKGKPPADLPVEQPTRFELVVNVDTARRLNVEVPQAVRLRADALIGN